MILSSELTLYLSGMALGVPYAWIVLRSRIPLRRFYERP